MWIDTNRCEESWHQFKRNDNDAIILVHSDDQECEHAEYDVTDRNEL